MPKRIIQTRSWSLIAGFALLVAVVVISALIVEVQRSGVNAVQQNLIVRTKLADVLTVVHQAESGQRGYLLTGDRQYLEPYEEAIAILGSELSELETAAADAPAFRAKLEQLRLLIREKMEELRATIMERDAGDKAGALDIVKNDIGENLSDQIRKVVTDLRTEQTRLLADDLAYVANLANMLRLGIVLAVVLIIALAVYVIRQTYRRAAMITRQRDELEAANQELLLEKSTREAVENQVRQLQKMEALGQLTGGVAHDFNNMLAVIVSAFELMQTRLKKGDSNIGRFIESGMDAADRAAALTQRLLAFSRQQALVPKGLDPNRLVGDMSELLQRTLGKDIIVETVFGGGTWQVYADAAQLENAIVNLCVNARDAMPDGGRLTIETANVHLDDKYAREHGDVVAGQYLMIAISDSGMGMPPDVAARAFDPFYTTKDVGSGTGLGLSQVHGFVKQSGGHVKIYSEPGEGTTVKIYLPRFTGNVSDDAPAARPLRIPRGTQQELVLVVEDEARVRELSVAALTDLGYRVIDADGAESALRLLDATPDVSLLFTDIVMPEVSGRKLAEEALKRCPNLKVLYTTGFTRNAVVHSGVLDHGVHMLQKPFTLEELANKVRDVLDAPDGQSRSRERAGQR
jgi:signal transduction histidine kinase/ActR/RegA family two-component response regulator